jgi:arylformamidase
MNTFDPEWLDRMYNNRALVADSAQYFVRWADASSDAREAHSHELDVPYGDSPMEKMDVFPPSHLAPPAPRKGGPVVLFLHGGYWRSLDKSDQSFVAPAFTNQGAVVMLPNYDLCPKVTIPEITLQMVRATAWAYRNAHRYGGDPDRLTVIGHSAGGQMAAMLLLCQWQRLGKDLPANLVKAAMSISGLYDLEPLRHTPFLKTDLRLTPDDVQKASPSRLPKPLKGFLYALVGADESPEFIRHNELIRQSWGPKAVPVCEALEGHNHFSLLEDLTAPWKRLHQLATRMVLKA